MKNCSNCEKRFKDVEDNILYKLLETSTKRSKKARLNDSYKRLKLE